MYIYGGIGRSERTSTLVQMCILHHYNLQLTEHADTLTSPPLLFFHLPLSLPTPLFSHPSLFFSSSTTLSHDMWSTRSFILVFVASMLLLQHALAGAIPARTTRLATRVPRPLKHVTTTQLLERASRSKDFKKRQTSAVPFPPSQGGYVSTGSVPWAVYTNLDIDCNDNVFYSGVTTQEACQVRCENDSCESNINPKAVRKRNQS